MRALIFALVFLAAPALAQEVWWEGQEPPTVYQFDKQGILVDEAGAPASPSPLEPGTWLTPGNATRVAPPLAKPGMARKWTGDAWTYVEDHGGETVYSKADGTPLTLTNNPDDADGYSYGPIPDGYTSLPKPGEFYEWDSAQNTWVENTLKKDAAAEEIARKSSLMQDADRKTLDDALKVATPEQIESYVTNKINAASCTTVATCRAVLQRIERALIEILKREAAQVQ